MGQATDSGVRRVFTAPRSKAYDAIAWAKRDSELKNPFTGEIVFQQKGVEIPESWSMNALNLRRTEVFYRYARDQRT